MPRPVLALVLVALTSNARADDARPIARIAFGSCIDQDKPAPIFDRVAAAKPDLLLMIGDNMYADLDRKVQVTPDVIRAKYRQMDALPAFAKLKASCRLLGTWDDHDYGKNDAGVEWEHKDAAQAAFLDFFGVPKDDPRRNRKGVYHAETFGPAGKRVQVILLDTRYHRSPLKKGKAEPPSRIAPYLPNTDADATYLGEEQWKWLEEQLKQPAELRLLVSSIQVIADEHVFEKWSNIPRERERLFALLNKTGASGVIILSGDRHHAEISLDPKAVGYPLYDVTASGLNQAARAWRAPEKNSHRVGSLPYGNHFGLVTVDWADDPRVTVQIRDEDGDTACGFKVHISTLKGRGPVATEKLPAGVLNPAEAAKKVGEKVTVQFAVKSVGGKTNLYLNTEADFRAETNFAVVLTPDAQKGKWAKAGPDTFLGKTVRATGTIKLNKDRPQLEVAEEKGLEVVGK